MEHSITCFQLSLIAYSLTRYTHNRQHLSSCPTKNFHQANRAIMQNSKNFKLADDINQWNSWSGASCLLLHSETTLHQENPYGVSISLKKINVNISRSLIYLFQHKSNQTNSSMYEWSKNSLKHFNSCKNNIQNLIS